MQIRIAAITALMAAACGGAACAPGPRAVAAPTPTAEAQGYDSGDDSGGAYEPAPPPAAPGPSGVAVQPPPQQPQQRPGLGTVWGENLYSRVETRPFTRAGDAPFAAVRIHYNDEDGVRAQMNYVGAAALSPIHAYTPYGGVSIALTDESGNVLPGGEAGGRALVVGRDGGRYNLLIENRSGGRYEVVASVDGLDVVDGRPADLGKRGYILEPYQTLTIDGFRRSDDQVAAFRFGAVADSYAARTSGDRNVGVVGVALFAERGSAWTTDELWRRDTADPFPGDPARAYARPPY
jgi:hypothetical protein